MFSTDGNHAVIFNGEIYNYKELGAELRKCGLRLSGHSDTEVLLGMLATWGESAFPRLNGMWAIAWLDLKTKRLVLSRDRFGIKPLYYFCNDETVYFASEIKAILAASGERFAFNVDAIVRYLDQSLLDAQPGTFFAGIESLPAGRNLIFDLDQRSLTEPRCESYWRVSLEADPLAERDAIVAVRETFADSVRIRLRSDVPVGLLLSGGVDSSSIAAMMREHLGSDVELHAISATSDRPEYDEKRFADQVAAHLNTDIHYASLRRNPAEWLELLSSVTYSNDEPVGSFSSVVHFMLMQAAKELGITVVLSGQGADELLCGYAKYLGFYLRALLERGEMRKAASMLFGFWKRGTVLSQFQFSEAKRYMPACARLREIDIHGSCLREQHARVDVGLGGLGLQQRQLADVYRFSVPALLHYEDRCSMAFGREIRLPFLDHRLVDLLASVKPEMKLRDGWTKWIFRKAMEPYLPKSIIWRKDKQGFTIPQSEWLKHELSGQISEMLEGEMLTASWKIINQKALRRRYKAYCCQSQDRGMISFKDIFSPIALEVWARRFEKSLSGEPNCQTA